MLLLRSFRQGFNQKACVALLRFEHRAAQEFFETSSFRTSKIVRPGIGSGLTDYRSSPGRVASVCMTWLPRRRHRARPSETQAAFRQSERFSEVRPQRIRVRPL